MSWHCCLYCLIHTFLVHPKCCPFGAKPAVIMSLQSWSHTVGRLIHVSVSVLYASTLTGSFSGCSCGSLAPCWHSFLVLFAEKITIKTTTAVLFYIKPDNLCFIAWTLSTGQCSPTSTEKTQLSRRQMNTVTDHSFRQSSKNWKWEQKFEHPALLNPHETLKSNIIYT